MESVSFWEFYMKEVKTKLYDIDIFIRHGETDQDPLDIKEAANVLEIEEAEINEIMSTLNIKNITKQNFYEIMRKGSSFICKLFSRELDCGSPICYTIKDIAYIYEIDLDVLKEVCDDLHIIEVTAYTLPLIFKNLPNLNH